MVGKLIKHEFRATSKVMWPIYAGVVTVALLARYAAFPILDKSNSFVFNALSIIIIIGFFAGMFALGFAPLVVSGDRFKRSILGNEGYLTMTLPATSHEILGAKLITSAVWYLLTGVLALLILIMMISIGQTTGGWNIDLFNLISQLRSLPADSKTEVLHFILIGIEFIINIVACILLATLIVYASFAIGYSANKHKGAFTVLLIYGIFHIVSWVGIGTIIAFGTSGNHWNSFVDGANTVEMFGGVTLLVMVILSLILYFITNYFITHKLNLE